MTTPSTETMAEMIRSIKEDQLPQMRMEVANGLQVINEKLNADSARLDAHEKRIISIEQYNAMERSAIAVWKWVAGACVTIITILISILGLRN